MKIYKFDTMGHQINQRMTPVIVRNTPVGIVLVSEVMTTGDSAGKKPRRSAIVACLITDRLQLK